MNIQLTNFRCHRDAQFSFSPGLNLIEGQSGRGKTTILDALSWCLLGKQRNVVTRGEKKCSVTLRLTSGPHAGTSITRTKLPSRVVVTTKEATLEDANRFLEDDAAQEYIYQLIGGEHFELTSYMLQKGTSQFFTLPTLEKRRFIESLSKQNNSLDGVKERVLIKSKELKLRLLQEQTRLECLLRDRPAEPMETDLLGLETQRDLAHTDTLLTHVKAIAEQRVGAVKAEIDARVRLLTQNRELERQRAEIESSIQLLGEQLVGLPVVEVSDCSALQQQITDGTDYLEHQKKKGELLTAKRNYEELVKQEELAREEALRELEAQRKPVKVMEDGVVETLEIEYKTFLKRKELLKKKSLLSSDRESRPSDRESRPSDRESRPSDPDSLLLAQESLVTSLSNTIASAAQRKIVIGCPHCEKGLVIRGASIARADAAPLSKEEELAVADARRRLPAEQTKLDTMKRNKTLLEQIELELAQLPDRAEVEQEYAQAKALSEEIKLARQHNALVEQQLSALRDKPAKDKYSGLRSQYEKELEVFKKMPKGVEVKELHDLKKRLEEELRKKATAEQISRQRAEIESKLARLRETLLTLPVSSVVEGVDELQKELALAEGDLSRLNSLASGVDRVRVFAEARQRYKKHQLCLERVKEVIKMLQDEIVSLDVFLRKIGEAETKCLEETIRLLNEKTQGYLDKFFPDEPLILRVMTEKESKKSVKTEIAVRLTYKSEECDLTSLSGGEYDRCCLAFMLAVNEICGSSLLVLDESIGSLDMTNAENVLEVLKETTGGDKVVILVQHQATCGSYDHVVRV
jgi:DNA repair exonuclease SbcCD ATPase subunit